MDEVDSPPVAQDPEQGNSQPTPGQELSGKPRSERSEPEQRINGLMASLGKRTQERDQAVAETQRLREQLDTLVTGYAPSTEQHQPQQQQQDQTFEDERLADEALVIAERTGHVDANNPSRGQASLGYPKGPSAERDSLRQQLNAAIHSHLNSG
jgi:hypothetical protein